MPMKRNVIAVIDDNIDILGPLSRLLSAFGYDSELYASAQEFLDNAMTSGAICLIVDIHLGKTCGIEFAKYLAKAGFTFPVIFMTADDRESLKKRAMEVGCAGFLIKPFSANLLMEALVNASSRIAVQRPSIQ
jgi:FixJ family two-component response regulator